ncbi:MAG: FecR family protein [Mariniphaga sp.]
MKKINKNMNLGAINRVDQFPGIELEYSVSKEKVWENLVYQLDVPKVNHRIISLNSFFRIAAAASLLLLLSVTGFLRFYTKSVFTPNGQQISFLLPDGSKVQLNAKSEINFHPYWFNISRTVKLNGEGYFLVNKGKDFKVVSKLGETSVLGTSFNIFSRNNEYNVTCFTGKVRVVSMLNNERVLLNPNEKAFINKDGFLRFAQDADARTLKSWRDNMFVFTGSPIVSVLEEVERQYGIKIHYQADPGLTYTGNFSRSLSGKEVLDLVCTSLGIKFDAKSDTEFLVN